MRPSLEELLPGVEHCAWVFYQKDWDVTNHFVEDAGLVIQDSPYSFSHNTEQSQVFDLSKPTVVAASSMPRFPYFYA